MIYNNSGQLESIYSGAYRVHESTNSTILGSASASSGDAIYTLVCPNLILCKKHKQLDVTLSMWTTYHLFHLCLDAEMNEVRDGKVRRRTSEGRTSLCFWLRRPQDVLKFPVLPSAIHSLAIYHLEGFVRWIF